MIAFLWAQLVLAQPTTEQSLAVQYYNNEEYTKAVGLFEKLYDKNPTSNIIYRYYYNTLLKLKDFPKAEKMLKKNIKNIGRSFFSSNAWTGQKNDLHLPNSCLVSFAIYINLKLLYFTCR